MDDLITVSRGGKWNITNLGAVLFAKKLTDFSHLKRKVIRVIVYKDNSRINTLRERFGIEKQNKAAASRYIREALIICLLICIVMK